MAKDMSASIVANNGLLRRKNRMKTKQYIDLFAKELLAIESQLKYLRIVKDCADDEAWAEAIRKAIPELHKAGVCDRIGSHLVSGCSICKAHKEQERLLKWKELE